jgi:hypothetical protein
VNPIGETHTLFARVAVSWAVRCPDIGVCPPFSPVVFDTVSIAGVEREAKQLGIELDKYMRKIEDGIKNSGLSDPLKTHVLTALDLVIYKGLAVVRVRVPRQKQVNFVNDDCFIRIGSSNHKATGPQIAAVGSSFAGL